MDTEPAEWGEILDGEPLTDPAKPQFNMTPIEEQQELIEVTTK